MFFLSSAGCIGFARQQKLRPAEIFGAAAIQVTPRLQITSSSDLTQPWQTTQVDVTLGVMLMKQHSPVAAPSHNPEGFSCSARVDLNTDPRVSGVVVGSCHVAFMCLHLEASRSIAQAPSGQVQPCCTLCPLELPRRNRVLSCIWSPQRVIKAVMPFD